MRLVIIGGTGHIGSYLTPRLVEAGHTVLCVSRGLKTPTGRTRLGRQSGTSRLTGMRKKTPEALGKGSPLLILTLLSISPVTGWRALSSWLMPLQDASSTCFTAEPSGFTVTAARSQRPKTRLDLPSASMACRSRPSSSFS